MSWVGVAVAVGAASGIAGGVQANQTRQRQKGIIGNAYALGQQRLNLSQLDTRQKVAEQSGSRGLDQGGDVQVGGAAVPNGAVGVGGAHTLGGQQTADLAREQTLEQNSLLSQKNADVSNVNAEANQGIINGVAAGVGAGVNAEAGLGAYRATGTPASPAPNGTLLSDTPANRYAGSFGGIDPVNPMGRGAWAPSAGSTGAASSARTNADFNVTG